MLTGIRDPAWNPHLINILVNTDKNPKKAKIQDKCNLNHFRHVTKVLQISRQRFCLYIMSSTHPDLSNLSVKLRDNQTRTILFICCDRHDALHRSIQHIHSIFLSLSFSLSSYLFLTLTFGN